MATLTASGVTTSNGQLDGFYTGTTTNNTTYPIGSYAVMRIEVTQTNANQTTNVYAPTASGSDAFIFHQTTGYGGICAGTWRSRGGIDNSVLTYSVITVQRVA